ncbi:MAG: tryptophan 2,3-dioxygenase [Flavobacteriales bacterium]|nr:tryptophan 2,3-dioxygenase [Flavobacteriales bacterium]MBQ21535.1 tryptophan 2,3-dioxygenase [Flavobacteriales bacterium]|tara:strand:- start:30174 stop:31097 length:924 start_codon:yes stop_codon:yes gene_type:complete
MEKYAHLIQQIETKYKDLGQDTEAYLKGLLHAKPIDYWDYIEVESLLSLQKPRTNFPDEMVFIMYHQVTELLLNMMLHEIYQVCEKENITANYFIEKVGRMNRYIQMLANSFDVMRLGMDPEQYNQFRFTLTPASGFQCASFRQAEICATDIKNLVDPRLKNNLTNIHDFPYLFDNIYWQAAGKDHKTGKKSLTLQHFEEKYLAQFIEMAEYYKDKNIWQKYITMPTSEKNNPKLIQALKDLDIEFNIKWPIVHLNAAKQYLESKDKVIEATGGSEWQKYLHPKYQRRVFFPDLWTEEELKNWAEEY